VTVPVAAVTFDAGQTLIELDTAMLAARLGERGVVTTAAALAGAESPAWARYEQVVRAGGHTGHWQTFMAALVAGASGVDGEHAAELAAWLWSEQPHRNLWRRPVPGMIELVRELRRAGVAVGVISNSEGRLAELFVELGWADEFGFVLDSARVGLDKPDRRIFDLALAQLGVRADQTVHVGDSRIADIGGARGAGWRAIWFGRAVSEVADDGVASARDAGECARALRAWGAPIDSTLP